MFVCTVADDVCGLTQFSSQQFLRIFDHQLVVSQRTIHSLSKTLGKENKQNNKGRAWLSANVPPLRTDYILLLFLKSPVEDLCFLTQILPFDELFHYVSSLSILSLTAVLQI